MKIRYGYVSNSSSTSYTVYFKENDSVKMTNGKTSFELSVNDFFDGIIERGSNYDGDSTRVMAKGIENAREFFKEEAKWNDDTSLKMFEDFLAKKKGAGNVAVIDISYHDELAKKLFDFLTVVGLFEVIETVD